MIILAYRVKEGPCGSCHSVNQVVEYVPNTSKSRLPVLICLTCLDDAVSDQIFISNRLSRLRKKEKTKRAP